MSHEPCTLFWPRSGFTPTPSRPMLPVAMARLAIAHHHGRPLGVLGDAEAVEDRAVAAGRVEAGGRAQVGRRHADDVGLGLRRMALVGDEARPGFEIVQVATLADIGLVDQALRSRRHALIALMKPTLEPGFSGR